VMLYHRAWFTTSVWVVRLRGGLMNQSGRYLALTPNKARRLRAVRGTSREPGQKLYQWVRRSIQYMPKTGYLVGEGKFGIEPPEAK